MTLKNNKKSIAIIGGGISGLSVLHYLKRRFSDTDVEINLYEKNKTPGGSIQSIQDDAALFERGPNGFLNSKTRTLQLVDELGLSNDLIEADQSSSIRYICVDDQLHPLPKTPKEFLKFPLLTFGEKLRVLGDFVIPPSGKTNETIAEFGSRRFGHRFTEIFLDSMVKGIYAGHADRLVLNKAFPRIAQLENKYHSLFRAQIALRKGRLKSSTGSPLGTLTSFRNGMGTIITTLHNKYAQNIHTNISVRNLIKNNDRYTFFMNAGEEAQADYVFVCVPSYGASEIFKNFNSSISKNLSRIQYAPVNVVGLLFKDVDIPKGFGYLRPSLNNSPILGVLFESNIYPQRYDNEYHFLRIMMRPSLEKDSDNISEDEMITLAKKEIKNVLGVTKPFEKVHVYSMKKAIPQYDMIYTKSIDHIENALTEIEGIDIVANYRKGIAFNDCIENAFNAVQRVKLPALVESHV